MRLLSFFGRFSTTDQMILAIVMVLFLGLIDYLSGWEVSILYLFPIAVVSWHGERWRGIVLSICCAVAWLIADLVQASQPGALPYWNAGVRLGIFLVISLTLNSLRIARERQKELVEFVVHDLRSPLTNVMAGLHLLADPDNETLSEAHREAGEIALISAERMKHLIDALLDISRMEGDRMP
ncbi:MAG TPA: histidine kinase dimerization/phospho-acceptor domain-containing protein, partial [Armatimonadota bacterium]|nr:histidine kinase dimerization/phospho-acceptor domain-containing protein [Armatimonadota bacterium]